MSKKAKQSGDFHKGVYARRSLFDIPEAIQRYFDEHDLVGYWLDNNKVQKFGGSDTRGYKVFKVPQELITSTQTASDAWESDFIVSSDGTIRRESMILGYMPKRMRDAHFARYKEENKLSKNSLVKHAAKYGVEADSVNVGPKEALRKVTSEDL